MSTADVIEAALLQAVSPGLRAHVPGFARVLAAIVEGGLDREAARDRLATQAGVTEILQELSGRQFTVGPSVVSFGQDNHQGNVTLGDVAGGNIIKLTVALPLPAPGRLFRPAEELREGTGAGAGMVSVDGTGSLNSAGR